MIISAAVPGDLSAILELEAGGFSEGQRWSASGWIEELSGEDRCVLRHVDPSGALLGVAAFSQVADMADLNRIVVHPQARGRGIGAALLRAGLEWAQALAASRMLLEVRSDNEAAIGLYRRQGFEAISKRRDYYGPGLDAVVMLCPVEDVEQAWAGSDQAWAVVE